MALARTPAIPINQSNCPSPTNTAPAPHTSPKQSLMMVGIKHGGPFFNQASSLLLSLLLVSALILFFSVVLCSLMAFLCLVHIYCPMPHPFISTVYCVCVCEVAQMIFFISGYLCCRWRQRQRLVHRQPSMERGGVGDGARSYHAFLWAGGGDGGSWLRDSALCVRGAGGERLHDPGGLALPKNRAFF